MPIPGPKSKNLQAKGLHFHHEVETPLNHDDGHFEFDVEEDDCDDEAEGDGLSEDTHNYLRNMRTRDRRIDPSSQPPCLPGMPGCLGYTEGEGQKVICHPLISKKPSKVEVDAYLAQKCDGRV